MYCGILHKQLATDVCPVQCMWRDRLDGQCRFTNKVLLVEDYIKLVNEQPVSDEQIESVKDKILEKLNENINNK